MLAFVHFHLQSDEFVDAPNQNKKDLSSCIDLARLFVVAKRAGKLGVQRFDVFLPRFWLSLRLPATHTSFGAQI